MAIIHFAQREVEAKIVYWGPALSGKTTNLRFLHTATPDTQKGELHTLNTSDERTLFFDYLPLQMGHVAGFHARFKIFSVPGQIFYKETRRMVLRGADAVVFVADSAEDRLPANLDSLRDLEQAMQEMGRGNGEIPIILQYNKRDVQNALPRPVMDVALNPRMLPVVEAIAADGKGVRETLRKVTELVSARVTQDLAGGNQQPRLTVSSKQPATDGEEVQEHLKSISRVRPAEDRLLKAHLAEETRTTDAESLASRFPGIRAPSQEPERTDDVPSDRIIFLPPVRPGQGRRTVGRSAEEPEGDEVTPQTPPGSADASSQGRPVQPARGAVPPVRGGGAEVPPARPARPATPHATGRRPPSTRPSLGSPMVAPSAGVSRGAPPMARSDRSGMAPGAGEPAERRAPVAAVYSHGRPEATAPVLEPAQDVDEAAEDLLFGEEEAAQPPPVAPRANPPQADGLRGGGGPVATPPTSRTAPPPPRPNRPAAGRPAAGSPVTSRAPVSEPASARRPDPLRPETTRPEPPRAETPRAARPRPEPPRPATLSPGAILIQDPAEGERKGEAAAETPAEVELPFLPRRLMGYRTTQVQTARMAPDGSIEVKLVVTSRVNQEQRPLLVRLVSQQQVAATAPRGLASSTLILLAGFLLGAAVMFLYFQFFRA